MGWKKASNYLDETKMKLKKFDELFELCNKFRENHEENDLCDFDVQISVNGDKNYFIEFEFPVVGATPIYINPNIGLPVSEWVYSSTKWMDERLKKLIIDWIIENKEVFGIQSTSIDETAHYRCIG